MMCKIAIVIYWMMNNDFDKMQKYTSNKNLIKNL